MVYATHSAYEKAPKSLGSARAVGPETKKAEACHLRPHYLLKKD